MKMHTVRQGEDLLSIVESHASGHLVEDVVAIPENRALFAARSHHVLHSGDRITLPEGPPKPKHVILATGKRHKIVVRVPRRSLDVQLRRANGDPMANLAYRIEVSGRVIEGQTDGEGWLREIIFVKERSAVVIVDGRRFSLNFSTLDPATRATGIQSRLRNLGYRVGPSDGKFGPHTARAVARFQSDHGLIPTGNCDGMTRERLVAEHGS